MPTFIYEASDKDGNIIKGEYEALDKKAAAIYLEKKELIPVVLEIKGELRGIKAISLSFSFFETVKPVDRVFLVRNLAAAIKSGLNIVESLDILIADATKNIIKEILTQAKFNLQKGQPLSATFSYYKKHFPPVFYGLIKAGEASGRLDTILEELGNYLSKEYNLNKKVKSAMVYPLILLIASVAVVALLLLFVLPKMAKTLKSVKMELPFITKALLFVSKFLVDYKIFVFIFAVAFILFFNWFRKTTSGRLFFQRIFMKLPVAKEVVKKVALARFSRTLGSLISSGLIVTEALNLSAEAVSNEIYKKAILEAAESIKKGIPLSKSFRNHPKLFPSLLINMAAVGERTGTLEKVFKMFSDFYEEEVDNSLKDLTSLLEPLLLLVMGIIVGGIAISILLPIYQLVGKFI